MKTCPLCGFSGDLAHCPNDGERLLTSEELAARQGPDATKAPPTDRKDALRPVTGSLLGGQDEPSGAPPKPLTLPKGVSVRPLPSSAPRPTTGELRDENYGKWAEPQLPKKKKTDPMIGRVIGGRYEVVSLLGRGGMGAVYKAHQPSVKRMVALKVLLSEFAENETVIKRFHQEALAASRLTHPNTISVYDFGQTDDGILYIAMEYLKGQSLAQLLAKTKGVTMRRAIHVMRQVCKSLAEAHKAGIVHRDLKPDNIFLVEIEGEQDYTKVLDFGVAKLKEFEGKEGTLTQAGMIFGTPKYMSPEQARSGELDARSDIYALGVILYELLAGRPPFVADNPLSILISQVNEQPPPLKTYRADVQSHPALEAVIFKALHKDPKKRQQSADELYEELTAVSAVLEGAPYDAPAPPPPEARPQVEGAIVPAGSQGTLASGPGGGTVVLEATLADGQGLADPGAVELSLNELPNARPKSRHWLIAAVALPLVAAGALWIATSQREEAPAQDAKATDAAVVVKAPDAAVVAKAPDAAVVAKAAVAKAQDAAVAKSPDAPQAVGQSFRITSTPSDARILDARTGKQLGLTSQSVRVERKTEIILRKTGFEELRATLEPGKGEANRSFVLKPLPQAVTPTVVTKPETPKPVTPAKPGGTKTPEIPIDLQ